MSNNEGAQENNIDVDALLYALDDESNSYLFNLTNDKLNKMNLEILSQLDLPREQTLSLAKKLRGYKYIDEMTDLKPGTFLRWISLIDDGSAVELKKGGLYCETKITDAGLRLCVKNMFHRHFSLNFDDYLIFQKLTNQELVLLSALDFLNKEA